MAKQRVPVSARAILQRINRKLKPDWKQLKTGRGLLVERTVGRYYVIDIRRNCVTQQYVDVEDLTRELTVLQSWEELRAEWGGRCRKKTGKPKVIECSGRIQR